MQIRGFRIYFCGGGGGYDGVVVAVNGVTHTHTHKGNVLSGITMLEGVLKTE